MEATPSQPQPHFPSTTLSPGQTGGGLVRSLSLMTAGGNTSASASTSASLSNIQSSSGSSVTIETQPRSKTLNLNYMLKSSLAGGIAGCAAKTIIAPLDRVKILFQTYNPHYVKYSGSFFGVFRAAKDIQSSFGAKALFQGHSATLLRIFPYAAIKFMAYEQYKELIMPSKEDETWARRTAAGSLAGVTAVFFSYPLDLLRTRLAFEVRANPSHQPATLTRSSIPVSSPPSLTLAETFKLIYNEPNPIVPNRIRGTLPSFLAGISNFYRGFNPTIYGMIPYAGFSFLSYETLRAHALDNPNWVDQQKKSSTLSNSPPKHNLKWWVQLTVGGLSGAIAQTASYPFEVIRRHMQVAGTRGSVDGKTPVKFASTFETAQGIYRMRGARGFFVGLTIGYVKITPMFAVSFFVYEWMKTQMHI